MKQLKEAIEEAGIPKPKQSAVMLQRGKVSLAGLVGEGLVFPITGKVEGQTRVKFEQVGKPYVARLATGWMAIKVRSSLGALSSLLLEDGGVSGILRVRR